MNIAISEHFNYKKLFKITYPSIFMIVFTSIYGVVDGFFVSNFVGKNAFTAVNFVMPIIMLLGALGFMFGTGGSALIAKTLGEGNSKEANKIFSMLVYVSFACGILFLILGYALISPVLISLGAKGELLKNSLLYARVLLAAIPVVFLQYEFHSLFQVAEKPKLGLFFTFAAGITNMVLDALFIAVFKWGIVGAAAATAISQFIGGILPVFYFCRINTSLLKIGAPYFNFKKLIKICSNGFSEVISNVSMSLVGVLYNIQLLKYAGENGVSAYGVLMYINFVFIAVFIGFSIGTAPIIGFNLGAKNYNELKNVLKKSLIIIFTMSLIMFILSQVLANPLSNLFVGYDTELRNMTEHAFRIFSFSFLFSGFAIYGSSFFTALNDGLTSAIISFLRTMVFEVLSVLLLPIIFKIEGIWMSIIVAEVMAVIITVFFMLLKKKKYHY